MKKHTNFHDYNFLPFSKSVQWNSTKSTAIESFSFIFCSLIISIFFCMNWTLEYEYIDSSLVNSPWILIFSFDQQQLFLWLNECFYAVYIMHVIWIARYCRGIVRIIYTLCEKIYLTSLNKYTVVCVRTHSCPFFFPSFRIVINSVSADWVTQISWYSKRSFPFRLSWTLSLFSCSKEM